MTIHLVTGATGFVGRRLVSALLQKGSTVWALVRPHARSARDRIEDVWPDCLKTHPGRLRAIEGDITRAHLGIAPAIKAELKQHRVVIWHLAASLSFRERRTRSVYLTNVVGTAHVLALANEAGSHLYYMSTAFVCGRRKGLGMEDALERKRRLRNDYEQSKHAAEQSVRNGCRIPYTIFRPSIIVGDTHEGQADGRAFGYYRVAFVFYAFKQWIAGTLKNGSGWTKALLKLMGTAYDEASGSMKLPWLLVPYPDKSRIHLVPIEYVIEAMIEAADSGYRADRAVHLVHPRPPTFEFLLTSLLEDIGVRGATCLRVPPPVYHAFVRLSRRLTLPFGPIDDAALMYLPYLTERRAFSRKHARRLIRNTAARPITRDYLRQINQHAHAEVFGKVTSKALLGRPRLRSPFLVTKSIQAAIHRNVQERPDQEQGHDQFPRRSVDRRQEQERANDGVDLVQHGPQRSGEAPGKGALADSHAPLEETVRQLEQGIAETKQAAAEKRAVLERHGNERRDEEHGKPAAYGCDQETAERLGVSQQSLAAPRQAAIDGFLERGEPVVSDHQKMMDETGRQDGE